MMLPPSPVCFTNYRAYERAVEVAEWLTEINPKLPVKVELTSWTPDEDGEINKDAHVFCDLIHESPSREQHFWVRFSEVTNAAYKVEAFKRQLVAQQEAEAAKAELVESDPLAAALASLYAAPARSEDPPLAA